jgi:pimeloyl-ACP methyl ester carboxylesterase
MKRDVEFVSKGDTVRGTLFLPNTGEQPYPLVVMAGGWCYVKEIVMPHYAEYFLDEGIACLLIDYRNFGASTGEPRQHLDPWMQIEDYRNAISYAQTLAEIDARRLAVWGISYSGGHAIILAAIEPRILCAVSTIPVVEGYANMRRVHGERLFPRLQRVILEDRKRRFAGQESGRIPMSTMDPENELSTWPFPDVYEIFNGIKAKEAPLHEHWSTIESTELLMQYSTSAFARRVLATPLLMVVAKDDDKTLWDLEMDVFNLVPAQNKRLLLLPEVTHMSLYNTRTHLQIAASEAAKFLRAHLIEVDVSREAAV